MMKIFLSATLLLLIACQSILALDRPGTTFQIFQFPANMIPRVDGDPDDWKIVPDNYSIGMDQLIDDNNKAHKPDPKDFDLKVKVGWVKGLNRLYFLYEAYDDYWDFANAGLNQDIFELVVDGDLSGGPLLERFNEAPELSEREAHFSMHGVYAQNYHIMTPALGKDWAMAFGCNSYVKNLPYANAAYRYNFKPGQSGKLVLEFWITPFDYAGCEGPERAIESKLVEGKIIAIAWAILERDSNRRGAFWNLSREHTMFGRADHLVAFRLMPLDPQVRKFEANWSFRILDMDQRLVSFKDETIGKATSWKWDFGDGAVSTDQNPIHRYAKGGDYVVVLEVEGPEGTSRREKIWDVAIK